MKTHKWQDIRRKRTPAQEDDVARAKQAIVDGMRLADIRKARELTQATVAEAMGVPQGEVSKIERRQDLYLSTLRRFVEAMDGELEIVARFPDSTVRLEIPEAP